MQGNHNARTSNHQYRNRNLRHTERLGNAMATQYTVAIIGPRGQVTEVARVTANSARAALRTAEVVEIVSSASMAQGSRGTAWDRFNFPHGNAAARCS